ncbi:MAG: hypothetical protein M3004_07385 [Bacteroidota bacterium]|nr:hypothetical protein [Bacteroidota bacterium]
MENKNLVKAAVLTLILVFSSIASWELYLRNKGVTPAYDDGESLWSDKRAMVYEPADKATVFIGSSRHKYDLDIDTWKSLTGDNPIQLAIEGNSPLPVLDDLANDKNFKGKLVIDVTEILFFTTAPNNITEPKTRIAYYKKRTPAQRFSFLVNHGLESNLVFLDKEYFSLNALLDKLSVPKRKGVFALPCECPMDFGRITFDRQNLMTNKFLTDTNLQNQVKGLWDFYRKITLEPPASGKKLDSILATVKTDVDKIKARGGQIIFVRSPSSGPFLMGEKMGYPREKYWDRLLAVTNLPGIYFEDYPAIAHFQCPEFSHLKPSDAIVYTKNLIPILEQKGWTFPNKKAKNNL